MPDLKKLAATLNLAFEGGQSYHSEFWDELSRQFAEENLSKASHDVLRFAAQLDPNGNFDRGFETGKGAGYDAGYDVGWKDGCQEES